MSRQDKVYYIGAAWFGGVTTAVGFDFAEWQFWLFVVSYVFIAGELKDGRR